MMRASRRDFVKLLTVSGISVAVSRLALAQIPDFATRETLPGRRGLYPAGPVIGRVDRAAKVTGDEALCLGLQGGGHAGMAIRDLARAAGSS